MNDNSRHIKRKNLEDAMIDKDFYNSINSFPNTKFTKKELKAKQHCILITEESLIRGFTYNSLKFPSVHPVAVYYDMAIRQEQYLISTRKEILKKAQTEYDVNAMQSMLFYYLGASSVFSTQLISSVECFCNLLIQDETIYKRNATGEEIVGQGLRWLPLREKVEYLIRDITKKNEFKPKDLSTINKLIDYRNDCVHPKKDKEFAMDNYENLFRSALSFNYRDSLESVKEFINYYSENKIIEECFCYLVKKS
jgi:hypothetical protein